MSVNTEAEEQLDKARASVDQAIDSLAAIVVHECVGSESYSASFRRDMRDSLNRLMDIRDTLK